MTAMAKAAEGVTWHLLDPAHARFGACGEMLDVSRYLHPSIVADHLRCQRPACSVPTSSPSLTVSR